MKKKEEQIENLSMGKQRRLENAKKRAKEKREQLIWKICGIILGAVIVGGIAFLIGRSIYNASFSVTAGSDFSKELDDNGFIKGFVAKDHMNLADYKNITVPKSEIEYPDESVESDIEAVLDSHKVVNTETDAKIQDGDTVSIEYVGTVDGVAFEGGSTDGNPTDLKIGSGSYIDDFEQQLIGHGIGEEVIVEVTFPEDYGKEELNGKDAVFTVNIDGIYEKPEFTDEFVAENLSEYATTMDGYRQYLKDSKYEENLKSYIETYLADNSEVKSYPKAYLKNLKSIQKHEDESSFEYMNEMYLQYYGYTSFNSFEDYVGMTVEDYDKSLDDVCKTTCKADMIYQAILESEGISVSEGDYRAYLTAENGSSDSFDAASETRGVGDTVKNMVKIKALEIVKNNITVQ